MATWVVGRVSSRWACATTYVTVGERDGAPARGRDARGKELSPLRLDCHDSALVGYVDLSTIQYQVQDLPLSLVLI